MINKNLLFISVVFLLFGVLALGEVSFQGITPGNNTITKNNWISINLSSNLSGNSYSFVDFKNSLLGWWRLDSGTTDELGINNGTQTGYGFGQIKPALFVNGTTFNGTNEYISIPNSPNLNPDTFTVSAWIKSNQTDYTRGIVSKSTFGIYLSADNRPFAEVLGGTSTITNTGISNANLGSLQYNSAILFNGKFYVNEYATSAVLVFNGTSITSAGNPSSSTTDIKYLTVFNNSLYAVAGSKIYRYESGTTWTDLGSPKAGITFNGALAFNNSIFAQSSDGGAYRYLNSVWSNISTIGGSGSSISRAMGVHKNQLYYGQSNYPYGSTAYVYRYDGGTTWTAVGRPGGVYVPNLREFNDTLYATTGFDQSYTGVYKYNEDSTWTKVSPNPDSIWRYPGDFNVYNGTLYTRGGFSKDIFKYEGGSSWNREIVTGWDNGYDILGTYNGKLLLGPGNYGGNTMYYYGSGAGVYSNASSLDNNFHLITATFNGTSLKLYQDGILVGSSDFSLIHTASTSLPLEIGRTMGYGPAYTPAYFDGIIDEVLLFNRSLNANEVLSLYNSSVYPYYNNFTNLSSGLYNYKGYSVNTSGFKNSTETRTFNIDLTSPNINNIFFYPNSTGYVDPNATIYVNATISDNGAMGTAILELFNGTSWRNISMTNSSSIYTTNLTLDLIESNYTYVIWTNDSVGNTNQSSNRTFQVLWDCTWASNTDLGATAGWDQNKNIGNITINNTGDIEYWNNNCSLDFRVTYNLQEGRIYYDSEYVKNLNIPTIPANTNRTILINATFLGEVSQESGVITLDEFRGRTSTRYQNVSLILVSNQQGPYLYQKITSSPTTTISLTPKNISLESYLRNLMGSSVPNENNTAFNVTFYWSVPSGFTNSSGNISQNYTNISDNSLNYLNTNFTFSNLASMTAGTKVFTLNSFGYNSSGQRIKDASGNTIFSSSASITFECYNLSDGIYVSACGTLDPDYVPPTVSRDNGGGGGGGAGGGGSEPFSKFIKEGNNFELVRGKQNEFVIKFDNPYPYGNLSDLKVTLSGILSEYIELSPKIINNLAGGKSINITAKITAPKYFEEGSYELTFEINGNLLIGEEEQGFNARKKIVLNIFEISREDLIKEMENAKILTEEIKSKNWTYSKMENLIGEIDALYNQSAIGKAHSKYLELKKIHDDAITARATIQQLNEKVLEAQINGISTPDTKRLIELAEAAFTRGDYALALSRLKEAQLSYALEVKGEFNAAYYVKNHPLQSFGLLLGVCFITLVSTLVTRRVLLRSKIKLLAEEEKLLIGLMKVVQRECFEEKRMSMEEYENTMNQYENRLNIVIQDTIEAQTKLANLMKISGGRKKVLKEEVLRLRELIRETQKDYFEKSQMETRIYQNMIKSYAAKLSEVEESLATIEAQEELKTKGLGIWKR